MQKLCAVIIAALAMTLNCYAFSARDYRSDAEQGDPDAQSALKDLGETW